MYNKILAHTVSYNGLDFVNSPLLHIPGGFLCLKEFSFFEVPTSISTEKYAMRHGEYVSPTEKKNRRIRLLFDILAESKEERRSWLKKVQRAFAPEQNPSPFNPKLWKILTFMDESWGERECKCQVLKGVELSDFGNEKRTTVSVELITDASEIRSRKRSVVRTYNTRQGIKFWFQLPFNFQYYRERVEYQGVIDAPLQIKCKVLQVDPFPLDILSVKCGDQILQLKKLKSLSPQIWDEIEIDSLQRSAVFRRGQDERDITGLVAVGSQWPSLGLEPTQVSVDCWRIEKVLDIELIWQEVF